MERNGLKVSIVVAVYNAEKTLGACLDSLMDVDFPKEQLEILVIDNNSTDKSKEIIKLFDILKTNIVLNLDEL